MLLPPSFEAVQEATEPDPTWLLMTEPPLLTQDIVGVGGQLRHCADDFNVDEVPAYAADEVPGAGHLLIQLRKVNLTTEEAIRDLARHCGIDQRDVGVAGLKDKFARTRQWISLPAPCREKLSSFTHPQIELGAPFENSAKLRRGHLHGNHFAVTVRELDGSLPDLMARAQSKLAALLRQGTPNTYGEQRFGREGHNLRRGLAALAKRSRDRADDFALNAAQAGLFNLYFAERHAAGLLHTVVAGDVLKKRTTGGLFYCTDPVADQRRLDEGDVDITGPIYGSKLFSGPHGTPGQIFEDRILAQAGVDCEALASMGRRLPGTRRKLRLTDLPAIEISTVDDDVHALRFSFTLPAGAYATTLMRELMRPSPDVGLRIATTRLNRPDPPNGLTREDEESKDEQL